MQPFVTVKVECADLDGRTVKRQKPTTTTTTKSEERRARFASLRAVSAFFHLEFGLTLTSTSTLPFPSSVTATPPFSPAPTPASPASGFHLRSGRALDADAAPDLDAGAALDDANANSDEEDEDEDALSHSLLLPSPPSPSLSAPSLRECRSPAIKLTPLSYAHMVASAAYDTPCILKKAWMSQRQRRSPSRLYTPCRRRTFPCGRVRFLSLNFTQYALTFVPQGAIFLVCSQVPLYDSSDPLYWMRVIIASNRGALMEPSITPVITPGLVMQLLGNSSMMNRVLFSCAQKFFALDISLDQATVYVVTGLYGQPSDFGAGVSFLLIIQLLVAALVVIILDGVQSGSGINLFIVTNIYVSIARKALLPSTVNTSRAH
ncbi:hypothetical protein CVT25_005519 [Psilocybe cyanescens]|uniref:Translocon Sec61/SecY plug domain-containing protein n=1 Tax=Psilocybe cyanescens TaxID=93625 RepID=A0A409XRW0_PSICY|nr:hypothetical protein CVT25_005519 [Psilocybe cyanescens]